MPTIATRGRYCAIAVLHSPALRRLRTFALRGRNTEQQARLLRRCQWTPVGAGQGRSGCDKLRVRARKLCACQLHVILKANTDMPPQYNSERGDLPLVSAQIG